MKAIKNKKPGQLKLSSMSEHWKGDRKSKSDKHHSQIVMARDKKARKKESRKRSQQTDNP